jgi:hypothetical protein
MQRKSPVHLVRSAKDLARLAQVYCDPARGHHGGRSCSVADVEDFRTTKVALPPGIDRADDGGVVPVAGPRRVTSAHGRRDRRGTGTGGCSRAFADPQRSARPDPSHPGGAGGLRSGTRAAILAGQRGARASRPERPDGGGEQSPDLGRYDVVVLEPLRGFGGDEGFTAEPMPNLERDDHMMRRRLTKFGEPPSH